MSELSQNGCVQKVEVVVKPKGKKRLVINKLNQFLKKESFKYEDLHTLFSLLKAQDYLCKFDLKSGYHRVDITTLHWNFSGVLMMGNVYCSSLWVGFSMLYFYETY